MNFLKYFFLPAIVCISISCSDGEIESRLKDLDSLLEKREAIFAQLGADIDQMRLFMDEMDSPGEKWFICRNIFEKYNVIDLDSASFYLSKMEDFARQANDLDKQTSCAIYRSFLSFKKGDVQESLNLLESIDESMLNIQGSLSLYLTTSVKVYSDLYKESGNVEYLTKYTNYRNQYLEMFENGINADKYRATILQEDGKLQEALGIFKSLYSNSKTNLGKSNAAYHISGIYEELGDSRQKVLWMIESMICDIQAPTLNYASLNELAIFLNEMKDYSRSVKYINIAHIDAINAGYRTRILDTGSSSIDIAKAFGDMQQQRTTALLICIFALMMFIAALLLFYRQRIKYSRCLAVVNHQLSESNKIKENYLFKYMILATDYFEKAEELRHRLVKTFRYGNIEDLIRELRNPEYKWTEFHDFFKIFDDTFLNICPDFFEQVNLLLKEDKRFEPAKTLPTELRVLAVIRLGMVQSGEIAKFLGCAPQTVYSYRNRMKNAALDRENFESDLMNIPL